jgi:hypothetical protein
LVKEGVLCIEVDVVAGHHTVLIGDITCSNVGWMANNTQH